MVADEGCGEVYILSPRETHWSTLFSVPVMHRSFFSSTVITWSVSVLKNLLLAARSPQLGSSFHHSILPVHHLVMPRIQTLEPMPRRPSKEERRGLSWIDDFCNVCCPSPSSR